MPLTKQVTVSDILDEYGIKVVSELTDNLEFSRSNASGNLSASIRYRTIILGQLYAFELYMEDYWKYVDQGRRAGKMPPIQSILQWLTNKRLGSYIYGKGRNKSAGKKSILATNLQAQRSLAYVIARKIGKKGTKGTGFYSSTFKPGHAGDVKALEAALSEVLQRDVKISIQEIKQEIQK